MFEDRPVPSEPDASDVVEGPVGSASLRDPATSGPMGADLEALPSIEVDPEAETDERPSVERTAIDRRPAAARSPGHGSCRHRLGSDPVPGGRTRGRPEPTLGVVALRLRIRHLL